LHHQNGSTEDALQAALDLVTVCVKSSKRSMEAEARNLVAVVHSTSGNFSAALASAASALEEFRKLGDRPGEITALETIVRVQLASNDLDAARKTAEEALAAASAVGALAKAAQAIQTIAAVRLLGRDFKGVLKDAKLASQDCRERGNAHGEAQHWLAIASARLEQVRVASPPMHFGLEPTTGKPQDAAVTKRLMEGLLGAKEALHLFRRVGNAAGEALTLQVLAKIYLLKREPRLGLEASKESVMIYKATADTYGAAHALLLEATAHLAILGTEWDDPEEGMHPQLSPEKEALAAAQEAQGLCQQYRDQVLEAHAEKVLEAARSCFEASRKPGQLPKEEPAEDDEEAEERQQLQLQQQQRLASTRVEASLFEDIGLRFRRRGDAGEALRLARRLDPRLEGLIEQRLVISRGSGKLDPAMDRLMEVARGAQLMR